MLDDRIIKEFLPHLQPIIPGDVSELINSSSRLSSCVIYSQELETPKKMQIFILNLFAREEVSAVDAVLKNSRNTKKLIVVELTDAHSTKTLFILPYDKLTSFADQLQSEDLLMQSSLALIENPFKRTKLGGHKKEVWANLKAYKCHIFSSYEVIRKEISRCAIDALKHEQNLENLTIIDIGTGFGDCLDVFIQELTDYKVETAIGIDRDKENIQKAKERYPDYRFFVEDSKNLYQFVNEKISDLKNKFVILLSSGSLTREVINNTYEALTIWQQAYRIANVAVAGGFTEVLINRRIGKKIGWQCELSSGKNTIYILSKHASLPRIKYRHLDLSYHAHPLEIIQSYAKEQTDKIFNLDLGLAFLFSDEITELLELLPQLNTIFLSGLEQWSSKLYSIAEGKNLEIICDIKKYVDSDDENKRELNKFSIGFYKRYQPSKIKDEKTLDNIRYSNPSLYIGEDIDTEDKAKFFFASLEKLAETGDDVALYSLAYYRWSGIDIMAVNEKKEDIYAYGEKIGEDYKKSLDCYTSLYEKGYPVLKKIEEIRNKIEAEKTNFDILKETVIMNNTSNQNSELNSGGLEDLEASAKDLDFSQDNLYSQMFKS
jgi:hypothetical protein